MKEQAAWLYRNLTNGRRQRLLNTLRRHAACPIAVLFYHRVAEKADTDWSLSQRDFCRHLDWLQKNYDIVSLEEAQRRIRSESCDIPTAAITFDDGYADNCIYAVPELVARGLPATYFVSTEVVATGRQFAHDAAVSLPIYPNSIEQIQLIAQQGIEIGAHTRNHINLGPITDRELLLDEIGGSSRQLEQWTGQKMKYFAFPYGMPANTNQVAIDVIRELGLAGFCTAYGALNWPCSDGFHIRRVHAGPGLERLKNWLTLDPRKLVDRHELPFREESYCVPNAIDAC